MDSIITISRQYGSGGKEIGRRLAQRLGIPFYDKDIIANLAKKTPFQNNIFNESAFFEFTISMIVEGTFE